MSRSVAVAIIHGMGPKEPDFADNVIEKLHDYVPRHLEGYNDAHFVAKPVYWAEIPHEKEERVWERVEASGPMDNVDLRRFIFNLAGDTLAYQPSEGREDLYVSVHKQMKETFAELAAEAGENAPLCIAAHSLGTVVAHNYLFDMQNGREEVSELPRPETPLERGDTLSLFCTYGSPIAIWRLRFGDDYKAIDFPGQAVEEHYPNMSPKWLNLYDKSDVLGYPISKLTERYEELFDAGYLEDRQTNVGNLFTSWNPMSHRGYLRDDDALEELAGFIADTWKGAFG